MKKPTRRFVSVLAVLILLYSCTLFVNFSLSSKAQEVKKSYQKSLLELAQEQDVEITSLRENEGEHDLDTLAKSEAIVEGRIVKSQTTLENDSLYTTYTIETQRLIKPFDSNSPLEAYQLSGKIPPEPIGATFKITRPGGALIINGHRISEKVPGQDELVESKNYVFFLSWSSDYKTYVLAGGISGVVLVQDDLQVIPLAKSDKIKRSNDIFFKQKQNKSLDNFLEILKKEAGADKNSSSIILKSTNSDSDLRACSIGESNINGERPEDPDDPGEPLPTPTPTPCPACSALQGTSAVAIRSPFTFSIDEQSLALIPENARQDFRNRIAAAAADWGQRAGVSITQAPSGQAGNVTVRISNSSTIRNDDGLVTVDPSDSTRRIVTFSDEWDAWAPESKDRIASHEIGHLLGLKDIHPEDCPGVESIMRQTGSATDGLAADLQLRNGYGCSQPDPNSNLCQAKYKLPQPPRPNNCDVQAVKDRNPTPTPTPATPTPTPGGGGCFAAEGCDCPCGDCINGCEPPEPTCDWYYPDLECSTVCEIDDYGYPYNCETECYQPPPVYICY